MKRYLPFLIVGAVALITFGGGFALYRAKKIAAPKPADGVASGIHIRGPSSAAVTIEEFGDFQCPPCAMMAELLHNIQTEYGSRLRVIFHHFPLAVHVYARSASLMAEAAHLQGKFWEMHDLLYREQAVWSKSVDIRPLFDTYAGRIGLDLLRLDKDMQSPEVIGRVESDQKLGSSRGVTSTPTLFINNVAVPPDALNAPGLHKLIEAALKEKPKS